MNSFLKHFGAMFTVALLLATSAMPQASGAHAQNSGSIHPNAPSVTPAVQPVATVQSQPASQAKEGAPASSDLVIGTGDLLDISVYGAPDFDKREVRVSGTGEVVLPLIGTQHIGGLTVAQAQALIASKLAAGQFFNDPQVSIFVKEYTSEGISVLGEVQKPGVYPLLGPRRLFDAISQAGGFTEKAGKVVTITRRDDPKNPITIALGDHVQASTAGNVDILPGDTVVVSKAGIVYVVGDVKMPGGFVIDHGSMTVLQAIAMAQGANPTAALNSAKLIRNAEGKRQETPIPLKQILASKSPDLKLQADDIVFVPNSTGKSVARRGLQAIVETATGVAIYHPY